MNSRTSQQPSPVAKKVMDAVIGKMQAHINDLDEGKAGNIHWRKKDGKVEIDLTTTK